MREALVDSQEQLESLLGLGLGGRYKATFDDIVRPIVNANNAILAKYPKP